MDPSDIIRLLSTRHYAPANLEEVRDLCRNYPEFNLAHLLKVRILESLGHNTRRDLKIAAIYSSDRIKLYSLIAEVNQPTEANQPVESDPKIETASEPGEEVKPEIRSRHEIHFSDEPELQADVIIKQHAPYAGPDSDTVPEPAADLLELEEEEVSDDAFVLDTSGVELSSETLIQELVKDESEMEEPVLSASETPTSKSRHLIRNFLEGDPGPIRADRKTTLKGDVSQSSVREHDGFITDTLARIYVKQGLVAKAIYAYEKLSLKYPEKSAYFAAQIEKVKNINHS